MEYMHNTAYLLAMINQKTAQVESVGIYSEEKPTTFNPYVYACLYSMGGVRTPFHKSKLELIEAYKSWYPLLAQRFPIEP
jgi:hypothetical protein